MQFIVLGPLQVLDDTGHVVDLGGSQRRTVVAVLLAAEGRVVSSDALVDAVWGECPPDSATGTLQTYLSRLRRALEPERRPRGDARLLVSEPQGYRLRVEPSAVDAWQFEQLAADGHLAFEASRLEDAVTTWREAEALWGGPAFAEHREAPFAQGVVARLEERRAAVLEWRLQAELALGRFADVAAEAAEAVRVHPLRENLWVSLALALYRSGRQAEALRSLANAREVLVEELGVEPGRGVRDLEAAILAQDVRLDEGAVRQSPVSAPNRAGAVDETTLRTFRAPMVGRVAELATLRSAAADGRHESRFVVIEGEPGIGKTRLLDALGEEAAAAGAVVVWGRTHESGAAPAFWPWLRALSALAARAPSVAPLLRPLLDPVDAEAALGEAGPATFRLYESVAVALCTAAADRPVAVLLDDIQWADPASLELLAFLATRLAEAPVLIGTTLRTVGAQRRADVTAALAEFARRPGTSRLRLRGLSEEESAALLAGTASKPIAPPVVAAIHARSGGNPFFAGELARLLDEENLLDDPAQVTAARVPAGVRDVVRRRLDRLPDRTVELLRVAAVLGRELELPLLSRTAAVPVDECLDLLEPAITHQLLGDPDQHSATAQFAHALVREVLVEDLSTLHRARLHLRAADALVELFGDDDDVAELIAEHLWAAVPLGVGERAAAALERAAVVAVRRAGFAVGEDLLRRAVSLRRAAGSDRRHAESELAALIRLAAVACGLHGYRAILDMVDRARELARRLAAADVALSLDWTEWAAYDTACDFDRADPIARRLHSLAEAAGVADATTRMVGYGVWGSTAGTMDASPRRRSRSTRHATRRASSAPPRSPCSASWRNSAYSVRRSRSTCTT